MVVEAARVTSSTVVVAVDVGKTEFAFSVSDGARVSLLKPRTGCPMTGPSLAQVVADIARVLPGGAGVKVGIEAAGHYHRPLLRAPWPVDWEVLELNPGHVTEQRRVLGKRTIKTDVIDLQAMTELMLAGRGQPVRDRSLVLGGLAAWSAHRTGRVSLRTATKNQLLGQLDRCFPGLTLALPDVLGTKVGRLVAQHFADPHRLAAFGPARLVRFAAARGLQVRRPVAERLVAAARDALPMPGAAVARQVLAADWALLTDLDAQIDTADTQLGQLLPQTPFTPLLTVPGWGTVRASSYAAAVGDPLAKRNLTRYGVNSRSIALIASNMAMCAIEKKRGVRGLCGVGTVSWIIRFHSSTTAASAPPARTLLPGAAITASATVATIRAFLNMSCHLTHEGVVRCRKC